MKNVLVVIDLQEGFINDKTVKVANITYVTYLTAENIMLL